MPQTPQKRKLRTHAPLLSNTSILILSAFLIGMASGNSVNPSFEKLVMLSGVGGVMAYIALIQIAHRRRARVVQREINSATTNLERRMDRHISLCTVRSQDSQTSEKISTVATSS